MLSGGNTSLYRSITVIGDHWTTFRFLIIPIILIYSGQLNILNGQTASDTFDQSEISTSLASFDPTCNGPLTKLSIPLPSGGPWNVTAIDIVYNMTAQSGGFKSHQRSYVRCVNTAVSENTIHSGVGNTGGVQIYNRPGIAIANGYYTGNTILEFEMRAWRTEIGTGCNTTYNKVDNFTWSITIHYNQIPDEGSVGIGTTTPEASAILELKSTTQAFLPPRLTTSQRDAIALPVDGMMIFNTTTKKLEIYASGWGTFSFTAPGVKNLYGGSLNDIAASIEQTTDGGFIVAGYSESSNSGTLTGVNSNGTYDCLIMKLDDSGTIAWQKLLGGLNEDFAIDIEETSDGGFIIAAMSLSSNTGTLTGLINNGYIDDWIIKLDNSGNIEWQKLLGGTEEDRAISIQETTNGDFIVGGYSYSSNTGTLTGLTNNGLSDAWILKLDSLGNIIWQKLLGGSADDQLSKIQITSDGGFIAAVSTASSNTGTLTGLINNGIIDHWIFKLDSDGNIIWQKLFGGTDQDAVASIQQSSDGGFIVTGSSLSSNTGTLTGLINNGNHDYWIYKLSDSGIMEWQKLYGGSAADQPQSILQTIDGGFVVTGYSLSSNTGTLLGLNSFGSYDYWTLKLNSTGTIMWQKLLGGSGGEIAYGIDQTSDGGFILAGDTDSSNSGSLVSLLNNGLQDIWIIKLDANGNPY